MDSKDLCTLANCQYCGSQKCQDLEEIEQHNTIFSVARYDKTSTYFYAVEGSILFLFNLLLVCRIIFNRNHRQQKESMIIAGWLLFDVFFGLTYMCSGLYRIPLILTHEYFPVMSKWECIGTPALFFIIITPTAGIFTMISTLDRFFCVMFPIKYLKAKVEYALCLMFAPYIIALLPIILSIVDSSYYKIRNQPATCNLNEALTSNDFFMLRMTRVVLTLTSVVVYIPITITMYKSIREHHKMTNYGGRNNEKKLLRMTITIALITSNTICMFTIPDIILLMYPSYSSNIFYLMNLNKGVINAVIFLVTQRSLRKILLGKPDVSLFTHSVRVGVRTTAISKPITKKVDAQ